MARAETSYFWVAVSHRLTLNTSRLGMGEPSEGRPSCTGSVIGIGPQDLSEEKKKQLNMDMIAIMTAILLQDGPFFCLRMMLIFRFGSNLRLVVTCWSDMQHYCL